MKVIQGLLLAAFAACHHPNSHKFLGAHILGTFLVFAANGQHFQDLYTNTHGGIGSGHGGSGNDQGGHSPNPYRVRTCRMCPIGIPCTYVRQGMALCGQNSGSNGHDCYRHRDAGHCRSNYYTRYYYDSNSGECRRFRYSGCGGNANRFYTLRACRRTCQHGNRSVGGRGNTGGRGGHAGWGGRERSGGVWGREGRW